jgi:uncharacterized protein YukE
MGDGAFDDAVTSVEAGVKKLKKAWKDIEHNLNWALKFLPDSLADQIRKGVAEARTEYKDADGWLLDYVTERGSAGALRDAASDWTTKVSAHASDHALKLSFAQLPSNGRWSGPAQVAYRSVVDSQTKILGEVAQLIGDLSDTLNTVADALKVFWVAIATATAGLCAAMICLGIATGTGVGAPVAIPAAIVAIVSFWGLVAGAVALFHNGLDAQNGKLEKILAHNGAEGVWPPVTAEMSDASVLDDDRKSDWEPNFG